MTSKEKTSFDPDDYRKRLKLLVDDEFYKFEDHQECLFARNEALHIFMDCLWGLIEDQLETVWVYPKDDKVPLDTRTSFLLFTTLAGLKHHLHYAKESLNEIDTMMRLAVGLPESDVMESCYEFFEKDEF